MASFPCKDVGMDCGWSATAKNEKELPTKTADHAKTAHNLTGIDDVMMRKVEQATKK